MATTNLTNLKVNALTDVVSTILSTTGVSSVPKITTITYPGDDTAADTGGGQTISISGSGFNIGASVIINGTVASVVTVVSATSLTFTAPAQSAGTYTFYIVNTDGGTAIAVPGISYSGTPSWSTSAGSLGTSYETNAVSNTVTATGDATISYSLFSGTLPTGSSLNTSTGAITGTSAALNSPTTYSFVIRATDGQNQDTDRSFSITINPDAVTWISPADNSTTTAYEHSPVSNVTLSATSAAGKSITFTANTLPTGVTITGNTISGTPTVVANTNTRLTANTATTFKTATKDINFVVNPDVVSWSSPADGTSTALSTGAVMSNVTLSATSAAGKSITYTANTLPTGVTITGAVVNGTPTVDGTTNSLITATATTTNRTATRNFTWVVSVAADTYWKNTTLLLNGETTVTPFINDASTNGFALTIAGDTKPVLFNPYQGDGYYSNFFAGGASDYLTVTTGSSQLNLPGDFTVELWFHETNITPTIPRFAGSTSGGFACGINAYDGNATRKLDWRATGSAPVYGVTAITTNVWHHAAYVKSGSTFRIFLDGVLEYYNGSYSTTFTSTATYIGSANNADASYSFRGYISNLRVVKGTAVYTTGSTTIGASIFTPSTTPLTAITNTALLTCQSNRLIDKSTNNFTMTKAGDVLVAPAIPFAANSSYSTYGSTYFDGSGDYLTTPITSSGPLDFGSGNWTVEAWVMYTGASLTGGYRNFLTFCNDSGLAYIQFGTKTSTGYVFAEEGTSSTVPWTVAGTTLLTSNVWHHIAAVRNSNNIYLYLDGVLQGSVAYSGTHQTLAKVQIGSLKYNGSIIQDWTGYIADVRIVKGTAVYTSAFTPPTSPLTAIANTSLLTLQYNGGATNQGIIDNSNFNNIVTRAGNASQGSFSPYSVTGWSNYFDGTGDYLTAPAGLTTAMGSGFAGNIITIECWAYPTVWTNITYYSQGIIGSYQAVSANGRWYFGVLGSATTGKLKFAYTTGTGSQVDLESTTNTAFLNKWTHVAVTIDATTASTTTIKFFVDGVLTDTFTSQNFTTQTAYYTAPHIGGNHSAYVSPWTGYISNLRVVKGTAVYTSAFTPSTTPLTAIANTQLLTCQTNRLIDNSLNNFTLTRTGDVSVQAFGPFGSIPEAVPISYSAYFDGTGDYLTTPSSGTALYMTGNWTIEFWVNSTQTARTDVVSPNYTYTSTGWFMITLGITSATSINYYEGATGRISGTLNRDGLWHHIALTKSGTSIRLFVDGSQTGSTYTTAQAQWGASGSGWIIGNQYASSTHYNGYISNFRVVNGTALYTTTFTPSTTPLTTTSQSATAGEVSLLTCQSTRMIDNSTNAFTITAVGDTKPTQHNPFGYTAQSATSYTPSIHGGSAYFDGTGDYLTAPASTAWNFTGDWTWECWVYPTSITTYHTFLGQWGAPDNVFIWKMNSSGRMYLENLSTALTATSTTIVANQWQHIALTRSSNTIRMFVNGVLDATTATRSGTYYSSGAMRIGASGVNENFIGYMSDMRIINGTALYTSNFTPPAQILGNYSTSVPSQLLLNMNNGGIIDRHSTNVLETVGNAQLSTAVKKYGNASMYFDGTGDYLNIPAGNPVLNLGTGDFTVEFWMYGNSVSTLCSLVDNRNPDTANIAFDISLSSSVLRFTTTGTAFITGATALSNSVWYHVALSRSGNSFKLFLNGTQQGTTYTGSVTQNFTNTNFRIGSGANGAFTGYIDDLRITKGVARYTTTFTPSASGFLTF